MTTKSTLIRWSIIAIFACVNSSLFALTLSTTKTDVKCNGLADGKITVITSNVVGTCYYSLTSDFALQQTSNIFENLPAGTYSVYAKDDNGIIGPDNVTINEPAKLNITETSTTASVCNNGTITTMVTGGTEPYIYSIDGFASQQTSNTFTGLQAGAYTIYVKDANGCSLNSALNNIIVENRNLSIIQDPIITNASCYNSADGTASVVVNGGIFINNDQPFCVNPHVW
jgi:hypothetical protein